MYKIRFMNGTSKLFREKRNALQEFMCNDLAGNKCSLSEVEVEDDKPNNSIKDIIAVSGLIRCEVCDIPEMSSISVGFVPSCGVIHDELEKYGDTHVSFKGSAEHGSLVSFLGLFKIGECKGREEQDRIRKYIRDEYMKWRKENV